MAEQTTVAVNMKQWSMDETRRRVAVEVASSAIVEYGWEKEAAAYIAKVRILGRGHMKLLLSFQDFDRMYGGNWHCVVGRDFGCFIAHHEKDFVYFYVNKLAVLLFRTGNNAVNF
jgi:dynein light chain LC8-type